MDPDATLADIEWLLEQPESYDRKDELQYHCSVLGEWLQNGGFEPDWAKAPKAAAYFRSRE